jgi:hypothetical protein
MGRTRISIGTISIIITILIVERKTMSTAPGPARPGDDPGPFYDRAAERAVLRELLASPRAELLILYGRRGVGKSALLEQALVEGGSATSTIALRAALFPCS